MARIPVKEYDARLPNVRTEPGNLGQVERAQEKLGISTVRLAETINYHADRDRANEIQKHKVETDRFYRDRFINDQKQIGERAVGSIARHDEEYVDVKNKFLENITSGKIREAVELDFDQRNEIYRGNLAGHEATQRKVYESALMKDSLDEGLKSAAVTKSFLGAEDIISRKMEFYDSVILDSRDAEDISGVSRGTIERKNFEQALADDIHLSMMASMAVDEPGRVGVYWKRNKDELQKRLSADTYEEAAGIVKTAKQDTDRKAEKLRYERKNFELNNLNTAVRLSEKQDSIAALEHLRSTVDMMTGEELLNAEESRHKHNEITAAQNRVTALQNARNTLSPEDRTAQKRMRTAYKDMTVSQINDLLRDPDITSEELSAVEGFINAASEEYQKAMMQGKHPTGGITAVEKEGFLNKADKARKRIELREKPYKTVQGAMPTATGKEWDDANNAVFADHMKALPADATPEQRRDHVLTYLRQDNIYRLPQIVKNEFKYAMTSQNTDRIKDAMIVWANMENSKPAMIEDFAGGDMKRRMWWNTVIRVAGADRSANLLDRDIDDAIKIANRNVYELPKDDRKTLTKDYTKKKYGDKSREYATDIYDSELRRMRVRFEDAGVAEHALIWLDIATTETLDDTKAADYQNLFFEAYLYSNGDADAAKDAADKEFRRIYRDEFNTMYNTIKRRAN